MESQKGKQLIANRRASRRGATPDGGDVQILQTTLVSSEELSIVDDFDRGSDPYNSTGHYCVLKSRGAGQN
jgi:hypothetical protein